MGAITIAIAEPPLLTDIKMASFNALHGCLGRDIVVMPVGRWTRIRLPGQWRSSLL
ncbi:MAG: hypothetical protein WC617_17995 [Rhodanobacter sp.]|jgi:hypothetical protein